MRAGPFSSIVETGRIALKLTRYQDDDQLALSVAMHTYMGLLLKVAGPHFAWNEAVGRAEVSELGKRLLLCSDILDSYLHQRMPLPWNLEDAYLESSYITLFRATLAAAVEKIRMKQGKRVVEPQQLTEVDVALLQRAVNAALRWMARPHSCALNRPLYVEMLKTKHSIEKYLDALEGQLSRLATLLVKVDVPEGHDYPAQELINSSRLQPYTNLFKAASAYVALFQATWQGSLQGHVVKVTRSNQGNPQCVLLLFIRSDTGTPRWKLQLQALEADFNCKRKAKGCSQVLLSITDLTQALLEPSDSRPVRQLVDDLFIKELRYRRLNLPARRRSWSKGVR